MSESHPTRIDSASVNVNHARSSEQRDVLERIATRGECPFCEGNLLKEHRKPILYDNGRWLLTENQWPYSGTRHHLLLILKRHIQHANDLTPEEQVALFDAVGWANRHFGIEAAGLVMRYGDTARVGSSVTHLHAHIVESYSPDEPEFEDVRVWLSGKKK
jgi:diadenosine tetraphosphate (Ap4A) HIT family hydrolase